jgi:peptidoglycan/LPS O-acetylase OafA/YrhL
MFLGLISYSVYLSHTTVIVAFVFLYSRIYALGLPTTVEFFLSAFIVLAVIIFVSYISYRLIEEPGMRLGRRLIRRRTVSSYPADPVSETGTHTA